MSDDVVIFHNPSCSKSRQTLGILEDHGVEPEVVLYKQAPPDRATGAGAADQRRDPAAQDQVPDEVPPLWHHASFHCFRRWSCSASAERQESLCNRCCNAGWTNDADRSNMRHDAEEPGPPPVVGLGPAVRDRGAGPRRGGVRLRSRVGPGHGLTPPAGRPRGRRRTRIRWWVHPGGSSGSGPAERNAGAGGGRIRGRRRTRAPSIVRERGISAAPTGRRPARTPVAPATVRPARGS